MASNAGSPRPGAPSPRTARRPAFAVRNLPAGISPGRAADLMEATAAAGRERKRRAGLKGWQCRVRKPAFALTLYWDGEPPADESAATSEALVILDAADLQTVIVRGVDDDGPCSILILNVVHPVTGLAKVRRQELYLDLMRWHLHRDMDAADYAALRGKADTFEQSLARQDLRWHPAPQPLVLPVSPPDAPVHMAQQLTYSRQREFLQLEAQARAVGLWAGR